ncbi:MAG: radical SAM protein [Polyangiales bacterium]
MLGRSLTIGCVALEITQRCNLDCTLCYLSDLSESIPDPPLDEIKRRAEMIVRDWGPNTNVQITGGDPTLRKRDELIEIFRHCRSIGLLPALFTNGILAKRELLKELCDAGMTDVAFHVDMTQERPGYRSEMELNEVRREYIENVRGLPTAVIFNTTAFADNLHEIPELVRFFRANADVVGMASFQLGADTGRGVDRRASPMRLQEMRAIVGEGFPHPLNWDTVQIGHPSCHSIVYTLQAGDHSFDICDDPALTETFLRDLPETEMDRTRPVRAAVQTALAFLRRPRAAVQGLTWLGKTLRNNVVPIAKSGFAVHKLSVFIQNFMDADHLEAERVRNCSFMVATAEGTVSMCLHNARRNEFLLMGVDTRIRDPVRRGRRRAQPAELAAELRGPVAPGAGGMPIVTGEE